MPIPINLKQILQSDTQQEKLDKVNYNFDQLVANGGGPMGATGSIGETGFQGATGDDGPQGIDGPQGFQGPADASNNSKWKDGAIWYNNALSIKTIVPEHIIDSNSASQSNFPPTSVLLGYANNDDEYGNVESIQQYLDSVLLINKNSNYHDSNIRLVSERETDNYLDIALTNYTGVSSIGDQSILEFKFASNVTAGEYRWNADRYIINDVNDNEMMSMDAADGVKFTGSFLSTNDAIFTGSIFKISNGTGTSATDPDVDKIAVALDNAGTIGFKSPSEIGASVPIGTIVSFHYDTYIDTNNFTQNQTINLNSDPSTIDIVVGRGIAGTQYEGWYLCNGQTWKNSSIQYTVPNLNSFSFNFATNVSQIASIPGAETPNLLGGGQFSFSQAANNISYSIDVNSTEAWVAPSATSYVATEYAVVKTPQLIYLGKDDLYYNVSPPPPVTFDAAYWRLIDTGTQADMNMPDSPGENGPDVWREINLTNGNTQLKPIQASGLEIKGNVTDPGIWSHSGTSMTINYGQANIFDLRITARGKDTSWTSQPGMGLPNQNSEEEAQSYAWFTDWSERWNGATQSTTTWDYKGTYEPGDYYNEGDIFFYGSSFYTVSPGLSMGGVDTTGITNPIDHLVQTDSSWEKGGNSVYGNGAPKTGYFYRLPKVEDNEESSWYYNPNSQTIPSDPPPVNNRFSLTPGFGRGAYNAWAIDDNTGAIIQESASVGLTFEPAWPALYEYPTMLGAKELYDQQGRWSWPAEIFLDIDDSQGNTLAMIQVPIISRWNKGLINQEYPGLISASDWDSYIPQYSMPYTGYTEGTDHWQTGSGVGPTMSGQYGTIEMYYAGGWDTELANNVSKPWDYWYTGQKDTEFRRYQRAEFKVLISPDISNQIYSYASDNPGSTIKFRAAWWNDKEQNGSDAVGQLLDPDGVGAPQGVSADYADAAWNRQPAGMGYDGDVNMSSLPVGATLEIYGDISAGASTFNLDDFTWGAGTGTDQVQYQISDPNITPYVVSGTGYNSYGARYSVTVNAPNPTTGVGTIDISSTSACQGTGLGVPAYDLVIRHSASDSTQITYTGSVTLAPCSNLPCTSYIVSSGPTNTTYSYTGCKNNLTLTGTLAANAAPESVCAKQGTITITSGPGVISLDANGICL